MTLKLSPIERVIYDRVLLDETSIRVLYHAAFGCALDEMPSNRKQQQSLGYYIHHLNRKIEHLGQKVVPGRARRTYCLGPLAAAG